jgi:phenylacetate-coenzyme A ligase PaaK-like adenylate-forming protein
VSDGQRSSISNFRDALLRDTFQWCVEHSAFYRRRFSAISQFGGLCDLQRLPILRRDEIIAEHSDFLCDAGPPAYVQYTTGTTGTFLPLFRSYAEAAFISEFYNARAMENPALTRSKRPLHLTLTSAYHGAGTPIPGVAYVLSAGVYDRTQAVQARNLLQSTYRFPGVEERVSAIVGGDILIRALTAFLMDEGIDPSCFSVKTLILTGGYTSARTKLLLGGLWNATVIDRYSLSEIFGGAVQAYPGGPWVFDVETIPELVNPETLKPVTSGIGVLVLTSLFPFSQMMPMVRYYTGDLAEIIAGGSAGDDFAIRLLGRERRSAIESRCGTVSPLVLSADLHDILESLPDVTATPRFVGVASDAAMEFAGKLHYNLDFHNDEHGLIDKIRIDVGLRYSPWLHKDRADLIATQIRDTLYEKSPRLRERVLTGDLEFTVNLLHGGRVTPFSMK